LKDRNKLLTLLRGWLKFQCFILSGGRHDTAEHPSWQLTTQKPLLLRHKTKKLSTIIGPETYHKTVFSRYHTYVHTYFYIQGIPVPDAKLLVKGN
jgi:hypothetical protein